MAQLGHTFDATTVAPQEAFALLPAGDYLAQIIASDMRPTKDGNGQYLWLELEIMDGENAGRKTWDRLNLVNGNSQTVDIAQRALSAICHACGKLKVDDSEDLHFIPMCVTVRVRPAKGDYAASNEIRGYKTADEYKGGGGGQSGATRTAPSSSRPANAPAPSVPAWKRPKTAA